MDNERISQLFHKAGFIKASSCSLQDSLSFDLYKAQVQSGNTGNMNFLKDHLPLKDPKKIKLKSALVGLYPYYPNENTLKSNLRVALYAQSEDYHNVLKDKLNTIIKELETLYPDEIFEAATDSKPILERDLAYRSGLGWIGKNTCLINKENGSLFFIAEILTSLDLESLDQNNKNSTSLSSSQSLLSTDHCGTCTKCIDACPTEALSPRKMIVEKCISYRNIESKEIKIDSLVKSHQSWFFGCDICQTVCPWNEKKHGRETMNSLTDKPVINELQISEIKEILSNSNNSLDKKYALFPLSRARGKRLKRNALFLIYENRLTSLLSFLKNVSFLDELEELRKTVIKELERTK